MPKMEGALQVFEESTSYGTVERLNLAMSRFAAPPTAEACGKPLLGKLLYEDAAPPAAHQESRAIRAQERSERAPRHARVAREET